MTILFILIGLAVLVLIIAIVAFFWAVNNKQFDDLDGPAYQVLFDDKPIDNRLDKEKTENSNIDKANIDK